jgi:hypothetical protein
METRQLPPRDVAHAYFLGGSMERSMIFPKGEKAPRRRVGVMSSPYTYSVFPFRGALRSGNESDPVG